MLKFFENTGKSPMYVGSTMIPPGEGKLVDVPASRAAPAAPPAGPSLDALVLEMLAKALTVIIPHLADLTMEALDLAEALETGKDGKKRKTLIDAIGAERIRRANEKLQAQADADRAKALQAAQDELQRAQTALADVALDGTPDAIGRAEAAVGEAQAKVDALKPAEA